MGAAKKSPGWHRGERYSLDRLKKNSASTHAESSVAVRLGITERAITEIRDTVTESLHRDALSLIDKQRRPREGAMVRYSDWAKSFGAALSPLLFRTFESYVKFLIRTIIDHQRNDRPIEWKPIRDEAEEFCVALEKSTRCASWFTFAFGRVGKCGEQLGPEEWKSFLDALHTWKIVWLPEQRFSTLAKHTERLVSHELRLAPEKQRPRLTDREMRIWEVIQRGAPRLKGAQYCRELENAGIRPRKTGPWKGAPGTYPAAYLEGEPWRHRIQDEKSKIRRKAELTKLAGE